MGLNFILKKKEILKMKESIMFGLEPFDRNSGLTKTTMEIDFTINDLQKLLFRFSPNEIKVRDYTLLFRGEYIILSMGNNEPPYIVTNRDQVYNSAVQAYNRLVAVELFRNAISFDFDAANDLLYKDVKDEFEEE
jgi:hypothetical protein